MEKASIGRKGNKQNARSHISQKERRKKLQKTSLEAVRENEKNLYGGKVLSLQLGRGKIGKMEEGEFIYDEKIIKGEGKRGEFKSLKVEEGKRSFPSKKRAQPTVDPRQAPALSRLRVGKRRKAGSRVSDGGRGSLSYFGFNFRGGKDPFSGAGREGK